MVLRGLIFWGLTLVVTHAQEAAYLQDFLEGNKAFSSDVYKELLKTQKNNFVFSPFSAQAALAMTQSGAIGPTADEIRQGLHLPNTTEDVENTFKSLLPSLKGNELYALNAANRAYAKEGYAIKDQFKKVLREVYQSDIEQVNFTEKEQVANVVNQWVEKETNGLIKNILEPSILTPLTRLILVNALYFKGKWSEKFSVHGTSKDKFYKSSEDVVEVDTMHNMDYFNYYESKELDAKFLDLPYKGPNASMTIVLPNDKEGLAKLEGNIGEVYNVPEFKEERVQVSLPKFAIKTRIPLTEVLKSLGVKRAFNEEADLTGIGGKKPGDLVISDVIQKALVNVTEDGTEAAAATFSLVAIRLSAQIRPTTKPKVFVADHPFIFYIRVNDVVIFTGRVCHPLP